MSILQYPEAMNASDLQVWNNATFDNGDSEDTTIIRSSWSPVKPIFVNRSDSLDSFSSKENQSPISEKPHVSAIKTPAPLKPIHPNGPIGNSQGKPKQHQGLLKKGSQEEEVRDERKIDAEIEEIQMEISRLSSKLEALRLEKVDQKLKNLEKRGRVVPAKFMEQQKQSVKVSDGVKKIEEPSTLSAARTKMHRRGVSLGPSEIASGARRGVVSLGPAKQEITPVQPIQNRRKSCFWKLQDIDEMKVTKERGTSLSISPKSRKTISKTTQPPPRQAATTVGSKKAVKKEDGFLSAIQPKRLFRDGDKSVPSKKPLKPGRVVASRYNQSSSVQSNAMRKRSFPESDKEDSKRFDKKRTSSVGKSSGSLPETSEKQVTENHRVKKQWEIPSDCLVIHSSGDDDESSPVLAVEMPDMLPRIRTVRCNNDSPRDSGPAKRVAELVGRKSYFCNDERVEAPVCQALSFVEEVEEN